MSRGDWGGQHQALAGAICIVAGLIAIITAWSIGSLHGEQAERHQDSPRQYAESAKTYIDRACANLSQPAMLECAEEAIQRSADAAHSEQDLIAQQDSAFAAKVMLGVSTGGTIIGFVGLWFIFHTLAETRKAARATIRGAMAARRANRLAQETARDQLRAYVDINKAMTADEDGWPSVHVWVKNFGQTPATKVHVWTGVFLMTWPVTEKPQPNHLRTTTSTIPPGHARRFSVMLSKIDYAAMVQNTGSFVIPIRVQYEYLGGVGTDMFETWLVLSCHEVKTRRPRYLVDSDRAPR